MRAIFIFLLGIVFVEHRIQHCSVTFYTEIANTTLCQKVSVFDKNCMTNK
jgi:hypothetical protein